MQTQPEMKKRCKKVLVKCKMFGVQDLLIIIYGI